MANQAVLTAIPALVAAGLGVGLLYVSWCKRTPRKTLMLWFAWLLVAASILLWVRAAGPEFGPVIALLALPMVAWSFVGANRHVRANTGRIQDPARVNRPGFRAVLRHGAIFLVGLPLAACAGTLAVLTASAWLPWTEADRLAFTVLAVPVVWGLLAWWATADPRLARPTLGLAVGGSLCAAWLFA